MSHLLCDQLEFANLLLVNKRDLVTEAQLGAVGNRAVGLEPSIAGPDQHFHPRKPLGGARAFDCYTRSPGQPHSYVLHSSHPTVTRP